MESLSNAWLSSAWTLVVPVAVAMALRCHNLDGYLYFDLLQMEHDISHILNRIIHKRAILYVSLLLGAMAVTRR